MTIRLATPRDCPGILAIYAQYINTHITFEYTLPSLEELTRRYTEYSSMYPFLVSIEGGEMTGYAYARRYDERKAYQWGAELSVYLDSASTGRGLGRQFYNALIAILKLQHIKTVYTCVTVPNEPSTALHKSLGFTLVGTHIKTGFKNGVWYDVDWYEKSIDEYDEKPKPPVPVTEIPGELIAAILSGI